MKVFSPLSRVWNCSAPDAVPPVPRTVLTAKPPRMLPVPNRAMLLMFCQLMPTRFSASRLTSATLTRSWTWVGASIWMLLMTLLALPLTCCRASRRASSATAAERTLPVSTIVSAWLSKMTPLPGWIASSWPLMRLSGEVTRTMVLSSTRSWASTA